MIADVKLNGESMFKHGWLRESMEISTPEAQTNTQVIPGRNSPIRYSSSLGRISYGTREIKIILSTLCTREKFMNKLQYLTNTFNGVLSEIIFSEQPDLYYVGTVSVDNSYDPLTGKGSAEIYCNDVDAYCYHTEETEVSIQGSGKVILQNDYMPTVPTVITEGDTTLYWSAGNDEFHRTLSKGTWKVPELELEYGDNEVNVTAEGTVVFRYREGRM